MRLQIEPSEIFVELDGVRCRVWNGVAESGEQVFVFVARVAVPDREANNLAFIEELIEYPTPRIQEVPFTRSKWEPSEPRLQNLPAAPEEKR